ncbi:MAG: DevR family CRISPR-associated autoregulator [Chloroflexaceae bacterium]|nr:DevR family CRISPR-associated autoregulator [Chloroflexaceae bacterium]
MKTPIYSLSLAAQATLDMHSLNNEGGEGNQIQTRMVNIVDHEGNMHYVNAISGDMLKHIQSEHFFRLAREHNLPLCAGCQQFDANRINADAQYQESINGKTDVEALDMLLERCALDDIAGILVTAKGRSLPRKSVIEFGWVLGLPETAAATNQSFFHVKYARDRSDAEREGARSQRAQKSGDTDEKTGGTNLQQAIFHRPASSSIYAIVCNIELSRVGYNDIRQRYALDEQQRHRRCRVLLESVLHTFVQMNGAMRSTQLPHLVALKGVLTYTTAVLPAPLISPLQPDYREQMQALASRLGDGTGVTASSFETLSDLADSLNALFERSPYTMQVPA